MRALAAVHKTGTFDQSGEILQPLYSEIRVRHAIDVAEKRRRSLYLPFAKGEQLGRLGGFTSLHSAKNAIRRHFGIKSRKELLWIEEQR